MELSQSAVVVLMLVLAIAQGAAAFSPRRTGPGTTNTPTPTGGTAEDTKQTHTALTDHTKGLAQCEVYAMKGHCEYYTCMAGISTCDTAKHYNNLIHKFCHRTKHHGDKFTEEGQLWARSTNKCVMATLHESFKTSSDSWCQDLDTLSSDAFVECAGTKELCQVLQSDRKALGKVFTEGAWMTVVEAARMCPQDIVSNYIFWNLDRMYSS